MRCDERIKIEADKARGVEIALPLVFNLVATFRVGV